MAKTSIFQFVIIISISATYLMLYYIMFGGHGIRFLNAFVSHTEMSNLLDNIMVLKLILNCPLVFSLGILISFIKRCGLIKINYIMLAISVFIDSILGCYLLMPVSMDNIVIMVFLFVAIIALYVITIVISIINIYFVYKRRSVSYYNNYEGIYVC